MLLLLQSPSLSGIRYFFQVFTSSFSSSLFHFFNPRLVLQVLRKDSWAHCYYRSNTIQTKNWAKWQSACPTSYDLGHMGVRLSMFTLIFFSFNKPLPGKHLWTLFLKPSEPWLGVSRIVCGSGFQHNHQHYCSRSYNLCPLLVVNDSLFPPVKRL